MICMTPTNSAFEKCWRISPSPFRESVVRRPPRPNSKPASTRTEKPSRRFNRSTKRSWTKYSGANLASLKHNKIQQTRAAAAARHVVESGSGVGSHGFSHALLPSLSDQEIGVEIDQTNRLL